MSWRICFTDPETGQQHCVDLELYVDPWRKFRRPWPPLEIELERDPYPSPIPWRSDVLALSAIDATLDRLHDRELAVELRSGVQSAARRVVESAGAGFGAQLNIDALPF